MSTPQRSVSLGGQVPLTQNQAMGKRERAGTEQGLEAALIQPLQQVRGARTQENKL